MPLQQKEEPMPSPGSNPTRPSTTRQSITATSRSQTTTSVPTTTTTTTISRPSPSRSHSQLSPGSIISPTTSSSQPSNPAQPSSPENENKNKKGAEEEEGGAANPLVLVLNSITHQLTYEPILSLVGIRSSQLQRIVIPRFKETITFSFKSAAERNGKGGDGDRDGDGDEGEEEETWVVSLPTRVILERAIKGRWSILYVVGGVERMGW